MLFSVRLKISTTHRILASIAAHAGLLRHGNEQNEFLLPDLAILSCFTIEEDLIQIYATQPRHYAQISLVSAVQGFDLYLPMMLELGCTNCLK
jgi:hypothetical protein